MFDLNKPNLRRFPIANLTSGWGPAGPWAAAKRRWSVISAPPITWAGAIIWPVTAPTIRLWCCWLSRVLWSSESRNILWRSCSWSSSISPSCSWCNSSSRIWWNSDSFRRNIIWFPQDSFSSHSLSFFQFSLSLPLLFSYFIQLCPAFSFFLLSPFCLCI